MDQIKIGKFIAQLRKEQSLTQRKLADALGISDKTVSKWETGNGLPEVSLMMPLCETLGISVNELLSGERLSASEYKDKAEENIMNLMLEQKENRKKLILAGAVNVLTLTSGGTMFLLAGKLPVETWLRVTLIALGAAVIVGGIIVACVLDLMAGSFECPQCRTRFVPMPSAYVTGLHGIRKRRLKCPACGEIGWCRKRITR